MSGESNKTVWRGVRPVEGIRGIWPARDSLRLNIVAQVSGVDTLTIYTVPAGKIGFISAVDVTSRLSSVAQTYLRVFVLDDEAALAYRVMFHYYDAIGQQTTPHQYSPALEGAAGYVWKIFTAHADLDATVVIHGWEEDA